MTAGGRLTNLGLLALIALAFTTGALAFATGSRWGGAVVAVHGMAGFGIVALSPWKSTIMRRGMERRRPGRGVSIVLGVCVLVAVASGLLHSAGARRLAAFTAMQGHVTAALAAAPFVVWHVVARPVRPRPTDLSRRTVLRTGAVSAGAAAAWLGFNGVLRTAGLRGGDRRFTGSHEVGSGEPRSMPVTQWLDDDVPQVATKQWRLVLETPTGRRSLSYEDLGPPRDQVTAVLDCTGGWWSEQRWEGVSIRRLVPETADSRSILVRSITGYTRRFPITDLDRLLLATHIGGEPLGAGHGSPARLVAPGRRGFWWVKWVDEIRVEATPWWWQPPFPLT